MEPFVLGIQHSDISHQTLRGVCVGYVTKEKGWLRQYFTRRAIINGGPVFANDASSEEAELLMNAIRKQLVIGDWSLVNGPIYIETRNFNDYSQWKEAFEKAGFEYKKHLNFHIDCTDKAKMWERLSERRRRQVRKALTSEGVSELGNEGVSELEIREWYAILEKLYRTKVKTPLWPVEFFLEAYRQGVAKYLLVKHEGKVIGGIMIVELTSERVNELENEGVSELENEGSGCVYEWYICGMDTEYKDQCPSVMATWATMEYANQHGLARFDVMGAGEPGVPYGVRDFKAEFGGTLVEHGRFLSICKPALYRFGAWGVKLLKRR